MIKVNKTSSNYRVLNIRPINTLISGINVIALLRPSVDQQSSLLQDLILKRIVYLKEAQ